MKNALVWGLGTIAAVVLGVWAVTLPSPAPQPTDTPSARVAVAPASPAPAPSVPSLLAPAAPSAGAGEGSRDVATPGAPLAPVVDPAQVAVAASQAKAEHDKHIRAHRQAVKQRNRVKRETAEQRVADHRARHAAAVAARPPDPNRPPPDLTPLKLRPGFIPATRATALE